MVCIRGWQPYSSQRQPWMWPWWCLPTPPYCSTDHVPSDQATLHSSGWPFGADYKQRSSEPKWMLHRPGDMWQLCPQTHSVVLNLWRRSCFCHHMMKCIGCCYLGHPAGDEPGNWCLHGQGPDWSAVVHIMVSGRLPVQWKRVKSLRGGKEKGNRIRNWQQKKCSMKQKSTEQQVWL